MIKQVIGRYARIIFFLIILSFINLNAETVTIAILAKDKAHTLKEYLNCIERQTWPKNKTYIYIRTNNNNDNTAEILKNWVQKVKHLYLDIYFDDSNVQEPVQNYKQHEWNCTRFKVLGKVRQDSVKRAKYNDSHYFVADCDNFIKPHVIETLLRLNLPIVAPFLRDANSYYSNYHTAIDKNGYFLGSPIYYLIFNQEFKGITEVPVVHCSYLIRKEYLDFISYDDDSYRYEYVIFSDCARKSKIPQYIDNRELYGRMTMTEDRESFLKEPWLSEVLAY